MNEPYGMYLYCTQMAKFRGEKPKLRYSQERCQPTGVEKSNITVDCCPARLGDPPDRATAQDAGICRLHLAPANQSLHLMVSPNLERPSPGLCMEDGIDMGRVCILHTCTTYEVSCPRFLYHVVFISFFFSLPSQRARRCSLSFGSFCGLGLGLGLPGSGRLHVAHT